MKILFYLLFTSCLTLSTLLSSEGEQKLVYFTSQINNNYANADTYYYIYLPAGYTEGTQNYPWCMFFVGSGEIGTKPSDLLIHGPNAEIAKNGGQALPNIGMDDMIYIVGNQPFENGTNTDITLAKEIYDIVKRDYRVDTERFYLTGLSMGGGGVHSFINAYPDLVAAAAPMSTANVRSEPIANASIYAQDIPLWIIHGAKDNVGWGISVNNSNAYYNLVLSQMPLVYPPRYSLIAGFGHSGTMWSGCFTNKVTSWNYVSPGTDALNTPAFGSLYHWFKTYSRTQGADPDAGRFNVALNKPAVATSVHQSYTANLAVDGDDILGTSRWIGLSGANDETLSVDFLGNFLIDEILLYNGSGNGYALKDFDIEYHDASGWHLVPGVSVRGNPLNRVFLRFNFDALEADSIRLLSYDSDYVRVKELRVMGKPIEIIEPEPEPTPDLINISQGKPVTPSSVYGNYAAANAVDGIITNASRWVSQKGSSEEWLTIDLVGSYLLGEIIINTGYGNGFALKDADIDIYTGSEWINLNEAAIRNNALTNTDIRISVELIAAEAIRLRSPDQDYVRIKELVVMGIPLGGS